MNQELHNAANEYCLKYQQSHGFDTDDIDIYDAFVEGAERALNHLWKDAQGEDLPPFDKEVIVLCDDNFGGYEVCFGHRPNPEGYYGKSLTTGEEVRKYRYEVQTYDKGGWNFPDIRWWLDAPTPNLED